MRTTDYNGYTNHATWYTASHIVLDEGTGWVESLIEDLFHNGLAFDIVTRAYEMREEMGVRSWRIEDEAVATFAKYFRSWFEGVCLSQGDSITATFARFYAEDIDWHQIAAHVWDYDDVHTAISFACDAYAISKIDGVESLISATQKDFRDWGWDELKVAIEELRAHGYVCATEAVKYPNTFELEDIKFVKS